jgi:hypothetical protein
MKQSGSQPPGSKIWWRWHIFDDRGKEITNRKDRVAGQSTRLADGGRCQHQLAGMTVAHPSGRPHQSAVKSLDDLAQVTGLRSATPIDLIYANTGDMKTRY